MQARRPKKILVIRLSSLGDVILSTVIFNSPELKGATIEWIVASEFAELLEGHPRIARVWKYKKTKSLGEWKDFLQTVDLARFDEIVDLQHSIRTTAARRFAPGLGFAGVWKSIQKPRVARLGYTLLKGLWDPARRPRPMREVFFKTIDQWPTEKLLEVNLSYLENPIAGKKINPAPQNYLCVMPSSKWVSKTWPVARYLEIARHLAAIPEAPIFMVMGTGRDVASQELTQALADARIPHFNGVDYGNLRETAGVLARSRGYLGSDTGLAHLAEAMGVPAVMIFGPTTPDFGFGPWRPESQSVGLDLGCRPCSKDGSKCVRFWDPHACLRRLPSEQVWPAVLKITGLGAEPAKTTAKR